MTSSLRVAFITVEPPEVICGKNTSLSRLSSGLSRRGVSALSLTLHERPREKLLEELRAFRPDVIHAFHAFKAGGAGVSLAEELRLPLVMTITGTDVNLALHDPARRVQTLHNLRKAAHVICPNRACVERLKKEFEVFTPASVVSKGVLFPDSTLRFDRRTRGIGPEEVVFLLPAGFRAVKNNCFPMKPLAQLRAGGVPIRLIYLGHAIEQDYFERFQAELARHSWIEHAGESPREHMHAWYQTADVVLNTSHSEGGSNVVLEAMAARRCVLASRIDGNQAYVEFRPEAWEESTGILYQTTPDSEDPARRLHDAEDFRSKAERLALNAALRAQIGRNAAAAIEKSHSLDQEVDGYLKAYECVLIHHAGSVRPFSQSAGAGYRGTRGPED
ncbi:MAG: glycosyltransferase family 4 protein [Planctomycetes bacterium]|nr:glycosyltransferase family 4 protein [Planctomycetota bacterium]